MEIYRFSMPGENINNKILDKNLEWKKPQPIFYNLIFFALEFSMGIFLLRCGALAILYNKTIIVENRTKSKQISL